MRIWKSVENKEKTPKKEARMLIKRVYNKRTELSIENVSIENLANYLSAHLASVLIPEEKILRFAIVSADNHKAIIEMVLAETDTRQPPIDLPVFLPTYPKKGRKKVVISIVPTGVRASIGGYIGDATPATNLLAAACDYVITNPNAVNGAVVNFARPDVLYTEGHTIDNFCSGHVVLRPTFPRLNRIGLIIDKAKDYDDLRKYVFQTAGMCHGAGGMQISYVTTDEVVGSRSFRNETGAFTGEIGNPGTLVRAIHELLAKTGGGSQIDVIALATQIAIPEGALELYHKGEIPDPHGGTEAITSHMTSLLTHKMAAHGPLLSQEEITALLAMSEVEPRAVGEVIGGIGFLGCVFAGLSHAPEIRYLRPNKAVGPGWLNMNDVVAVVGPHNALGGFPMLVAAARGIPIIAVKENDTLLTVTKSSLGYGDHAMEVENYLEAAAVVARLAEGDNHFVSSRERAELLEEGCKIAESAGIALDSLRRPLLPFEMAGRA